MIRRATLLVAIAGVATATAVGCGGTTTNNLFAPNDASTDGSSELPGADAGPVKPEKDAAAKDATTEAGPACVSSPGNIELPDNNCDDDGDGEVDNVASCDDSLDVGGGAEDFAKALGICQKAEGGKWGLVSATFSDSYGKPTLPDSSQHGILGKFGAVLKPREGASLGVLSTGWAREFNGANGTDDFQPGLTMTGPGEVPPGYPKAAAGCEIDPTVSDVITLELKVKVPDNVKGVSFDFDFYSSEWPQWVCTKFNDGFVAMLTSKAFHGGSPDNMAFDANQNPITVNSGFFDRCTPGTTTGCSGTPPVEKVATCAGGVSELAGTGFFKNGVYCGSMSSTGGGATGWRTSSAPVRPGEQITLTFVIWDTGDASFDSSVLLDNLKWEPK